MIAAAARLLLLASIGQAADSDSLHLVARHLPDSALTAEARVRPHAVRDAVAEAMSRSVRLPARERQMELATAERLAGAYALAWHDPFLLRQVAWFVRMSSERRATTCRRSDRHTRG